MIRDVQLYLAFLFLFRPNNSSLTLGTFSALRESVRAIKGTISSLNRHFRVMEKLLKNIRGIYIEEEFKGSMRDGDLSYPRIDDKWETKATGMGIEFW